MFNILRFQTAEQGLTQLFLFQNIQKLAKKFFFSFCICLSKEIFSSSTFSLFSEKDCKNVSISAADEWLFLFLFLTLLFPFFAPSRLLPLSSSSSSSPLSSHSAFESLWLDEEEARRATSKVQLGLTLRLSPIHSCRLS